MRTIKLKEDALSIQKRLRDENKLPDSIIAATSSFMEIPLITADSGLKKIEGIELIHYER